MSETVHTAITFALISGVVMAFVGLICSRYALEIMGTPDDVIAKSTLYMRIYFCGMPFFMLYNYGAAILRAVGDTRRPLYFLTAAGVVNVVLNLFFVIVCHMAAAGVATASAISLYISASLVMIHLLRRTDDCKVSLRKIRLHPKACKAVLMLGIPTGLQNGIFAIANLFVQTGVNSFDAVMVSGNAAAANADSLIYNVMFSFYTACASFIGQNWGAGNKKRMLKSYKVSLTYAFIFGAILGGLLLVFGPQFLSLFATEPTVIDAGMQRIRIMAFSYAFSCFMDGSIAASRGIGKSIPPTIIVILGSCVFRIVWIYTVFAHFQTISSLYLLYIFSWGITGLAETLFFVVSFNIIYSKNSPSSIGGR